MVSGETSTPGEQLAWDGAQLLAATHRIREVAYVVRDSATGRVGVAFGRPAGQQVLAMLPALYPEWLGDRSFSEVHRVRFPYSAGAMANGIATTDLVCAMSRAGFMSFFGAAGLSLPRVTAALDELDSELGASSSWGMNLIHSPAEPDHEQATADLYVARGVRRVSAAAYMSLTLPITQYAYTGLRCDARGRIHRRNHVFAKVSRPEVARRFMEPAPKSMLDALVAAGRLTAAEAAIAATLPVAEDYMVEADSGGHTDNQSLTALLPTVMGLRDEIATARGYRRPLRIGAAGGLGTPSAVAAAFSLGAAFVLTGSVNQAAVESGLDPAGRRMLADAGLADVVMAPAADMFELGVEVQVLQRGTMFGSRARRLYDLYRRHDSLQTLPSRDVKWLEEKIFRVSLTDAWQQTHDYWAARDPRENARAAGDPHHQMALLFRAYLGQSSRWAIAGDPARRLDYQIWCGPAMGAFNAWTAGSFLSKPGNRSAVQIARNLLEGAAVVTRAQQLRSYGVPVPAAAFNFRPRPLG